MRTQWRSRAPKHTSTIFFCWSGNNCCDAFSEKLRFIISSTLSASTRRRLRIMLYVNRNCDASFPGFPVIMWLKVDCLERNVKLLGFTRAFTSTKTYFGDIIAGDDDCPNRVEPSATSTPCHLCILPRQYLPKATPVMLANSREDHRFRWHVNTLEMNHERVILRITITTHHCKGFCCEENFD